MDEIAKPIGWLFALTFVVQVVAVISGSTPLAIMAGTWLIADTLMVIAIWHFWEKNEDDAPQETSE